MMNFVWIIALVLWIDAERVTNRSVPRDIEANGLVTQLGSPRYEERESAADALGRLGLDALPALRAARQDKDPEIKNRAAVLLDDIERDLLTRPTLVSFDENETHLNGVAEQLTKRLGVNTRLAPGLDIEALDPALRKADPLPFWDALDRLGLVVVWPKDGLQPQPLNDLKILLGRGSRTQSATSGPFRITLGPWKKDNSTEPRRFGDLGPRDRASGSRGTGLTLSVMIEPRLSFRPTGPLKIDEAVDEQDRSLFQDLERTSSNKSDDAQKYVSVPVPLQPASPAVKRMKRFRGSLPVEVEARKLEPVRVELPRGEDKPVWCGDATLVVRSFKEPAFANSTSIEIVVRPIGWIGNRMRGGGFQRNFNPDFSEFERVIRNLERNIEIVDAQGRTLTGLTPRTLRPGPEGFRFVYDLVARNGLGPPAEVRYYGTIRTNTEVTFNFADIRLE